MIGKRKRPDGLPFNLYATHGKRIVSFGYKPGNTWLWRYSAPRAQPEKVAQARAQAIRRASEENGATPVAGTFADLADHYFEWQEKMPAVDLRRKASVTLKENRREVGFLNEFFGSMAPNAVKPQHIYEYLDIRAQGGAPAKANKEVGLLSAILEYGRRKGLLDVNPCQDIKYNPTVAKTRLVTQQEVDFTLKIARERGGQYLVQALCLRAAYLAVGRPDEMRNLRRQHIKDEGLQIPVGKRKGAEAQRTKTILWSDQLKATIDEALSLQRIAGIFVFGNVRGQPYNRNTWSNNWRKLMGFCAKAAKIEGVEFKPFALSDMRPRAVTKRKSDGDQNIVDAGGWSSERMPNQVYDRRRNRIVDATE